MSTKGWRKTSHHLPRALKPDEVVAVECVRAAARSHSDAMLDLSRARTPVQREEAQRNLAEAARSLDLAQTDLVDVLLG